MVRPRRSETPPNPPEAVAARRLRAAEEALDVRDRASEPFLELEVSNPAHRSRYRVLFPEYPSREGALCTCTDFARRGLGTCKHLEAAWSWLAAHPVAPGGPVSATPARSTEGLWEQLEARADRLRRQPPRTIRELEREGSLLYEEGIPLPEPGKGDSEEVRRSRSDRTGPTTTSRARP